MVSKFDFRALQTALLMIAVTFLPVSNIPFRVGFVLAERVLYLPSLGYCLMVGLAVSQCAKRLQLQNKVPNAIALAVLSECHFRFFLGDLPVSTRRSTGLVHGEVDTSKQRMAHTAEALLIRCPGLPAQCQGPLQLRHRP